MIIKFFEFLFSRHGVKVGPGPRDLRPRDPGTRDPGTLSKFKSGTREPPQSLKVVPQDPLQNLKVGSRDPLRSLKVGPS